MITSKKFTIAVFVAFVCMLFYSHAAYAAEFGPFQGRIVDIETKEPIEGVVVLIEWRKHHFFAGSTFIDAQEALTDKNGNFNIPGIWVLNPWTRFVASADMTIFKSGFKAIITGEWEDWEIFSPNPKLGYILSLEDHKPVFGLKKVADVDERWCYVGYATPLVSSPTDTIEGVFMPPEKAKLLMKEVTLEEAILSKIKLYPSYPTRPCRY